jgi:hypothetical protein
LRRNHDRRTNKIGQAAPKAIPARSIHPDRGLQYPASHWTDQAAQIAGPVTDASIAAGPINGLQLPPIKRVPGGLGSVSIKT